MTASMPQVNAEFGAAPEITFPAPEPPAGLKVAEVVEGNGPMVRRGDTVTVNYHGVVWGGDAPFDSSFDRHQPASFGIGVGQVIKGWDQTVPGHNIGSRLVVSIPPEYGYGSQGMPQAGIGGEDTLVFVIDIISTR
ncbi:FKBP-type peptidyl-prolyl cis-trans isomerase [Bifidobacterium subtile]|jgi:peptidylprolyl isomerase|uniref:Peptidyl-prolyl cis-trans isomerase n=1 Tax=Bifidobacterium subtile TaxID=77635 RepID=A0A087E9R7_9BIFI|nr:FKBP-type peptidyl-prolyl cis-trans isomerase [Bifidobacterium subtile]KFJ04518.1 peptidyl-prolyl cis-trans isomerase [Bifidobacterium subtile]MCI1222848.1 FKBP-type peptidyl-prolyl cis-trans isomerase [Bifidobacterium subtile]MCI1241309.1 FKBP-type peptidyl-prolyl cis-trans isomerase [Bifidobacterium subtile]MCI1257973.1 FKBP-type peptidyl-prolyl cis-trans isomerase [Bifidobacterium subtile]QOL35636.1 FKBP-type peptidyl-prolyl cis-trans isomerase [Bifidobacterium subtile]